jgi:outer membrane protein assembly factor BamB
MKLLTKTVLIAALLVAIDPLIQAEDWSLFRGDPQLHGRAGSLPDKLVPLWLFEIEEGIESGAAIVDGVVYVGALDGKLYAVSLADGSQVWVYEATDEIKASPSVRDGTVYVGDSGGVFHAVDAATGNARWTFEAEGEIVSSANFHEKRIVFGSNDQFLYCLKQDGSLAWKIETGGYVYGTPAIVDGVAYSAGCDGFLRAIDISSGEQGAQIHIGAYIGASPSVRDGVAYMGTFENQVVAVDLAAGELVWAYENPERQFPYLSSAALGEDRLIVGGRDKSVHAIKLEDGSALWSYRTKAKVDSSPVISGERVYVGSMTGELFAFNVKSGEVEWRFDTGSGLMATPAIADGRLVIGTVDGQLYCLGDAKQQAP